MRNNRYQPHHAISVSKSRSLLRVPCALLIFGPVYVWGADPAAAAPDPEVTLCSLQDTTGVVMVRVGDVSDWASLVVTVQGITATEHPPGQTGNWREFHADLPAPIAPPPVCTATLMPPAPDPCPSDPEPPGSPEPPPAPAPSSTTSSLSAIAPTPLPANSSDARPTSTPTPTQTVPTAARSTAPASSKPSTRPTTSTGQQPIASRSPSLNPTLLIVLLIVLMLALAAWPARRSRHVSRRHVASTDRKRP